MVDRFEQFSLAIMEISRHWHKMAADEMENHGLKGSHAVYLLTMYRYPEGITAPRLCEICGKDKSDDAHSGGERACKKGRGSSESLPGRL